MEKEPQYGCAMCGWFMNSEEDRRVEKNKLPTSLIENEVELSSTSLKEKANRFAIIGKFPPQKGKSEAEGSTSSNTSDDAHLFFIAGLKAEDRKADVSQLSSWQTWNTFVMSASEEDSADLLTRFNHWSKSKDAVDHGACSINVSLERGILWVHENCWELLQGISKSSNRGILTPAAFWRGAKIFLEGWYQSRLANSRYAYFPYDNMPLHNDRYYSDEQDEWTLLDAENKPLDGFPVRYAYSRSADLMVHPGSVNNQQESSAGPLMKLPNEVLGAIAQYLSIESNAAAGAACRRMYNVVQDATHRKILRYHPQLLPITPHEEREWDRQKKIGQKYFRRKEIRRVDSTFPWLLYLRICLSAGSHSLQERMRVWSGAIDIHADLLEKGLLV